MQVTCDSSGVSEVSANGPGGPPHVDVVDETWIGVPPSSVAPYLQDRRNWARWWPELELELIEDRGEKGVRWTARTKEAAGRMEVWLQPDREGTVAHYFVALELLASGRAADGRELARHFRVRDKAVFWALGDHLDPARAQRLVAPRSPQDKPFVL